MTDTKITINSADDIIKAMKTDPSYQEWLEGLALNALKGNTELFNSWKKWFDEKE